MIGKVYTLIAYASKTLTDTETRYANIERELLGVVGGLEKFHYYTFGCPVMVLTDHKPLIAGFEKNHLSMHHPDSSVYYLDYTSIMLN